MNWRVGCLLLVVVLLCSCGGKEPSGDGGSSQGPPEKGTYEVVKPDLSADASPTQVAEALFAALDADDAPRLRGLAARRAITEDVNRIGRGRLRFSEDKAVELAVAGWGATYVFIEAGSSTVMEEQVTGDRASVFADCRNDADGKPRRLEVELAQEEEGWRVCRLVPKDARPPARR